MPNNLVTEPIGPIFPEGREKELAKSRLNATLSVIKAARDEEEQRFKADAIAIAMSAKAAIKKLDIKKGIKGEASKSLQASIEKDTCEYDKVGRWRSGSGTF